MRIYLLTTCAAVIVSAGIARADEPQLPPLKEGLWESHTEMVIQNTKHESVLKLCRTHELDKSMKDQTKTLGESMRKARQCTDVTTIDDKYVGSCPADMKPGDGVMADGKKFNFFTPTSTPAHAPAP